MPAKQNQGGVPASRKPLTDIADVTPAWLTAILRREGVVERAAVTGVTPIPGPMPHGWRLELRYSGDVPALAPARLFLKFRHQQNAVGGMGKPEVTAYRTMAGRRERLPMLLRCYDAVYDDERRVSHVLLHDFSATHSLPRFPVPAAAHRDAITDCTAEFHSYWWDHPELTIYGALAPNTEVDCRSATAYEEFVGRYRDAFKAFVAYMGARLPDDERRLFDAILTALPAFWPRYLARRFTEHKNITLVMGDGHWSQFACPNDPAVGLTYMFDLECLYAGLPAAEWAYRVPLDWLPEQRRALEGGVIARYLAGLRAHGVQGYSWDDFWLDYRLSTIFVAVWLLRPFTARWGDHADRERQTRAIPRWWAGVYQRLLANFHDLRCESLLS